MSMWKTLVVISPEILNLIPALNRKTFINQAKVSHMFWAIILFKAHGDHPDMWAQLMHWVSAEDFYGEVWDAERKRQIRNEIRSDYRIQAKNRRKKESHENI